MATATTPSESTIRGLRAKAALFDELVEQLARSEAQVEALQHELETLRAELAVRIDPAWREIANDLAAALRPYSMFREQSVEDGRIVVHTRVPGATLHASRAALDRLARQLAVESYRRDGIPVPEDKTPAISQQAA